MVLEKTLESPLDCKEMHPVHSKGDQPWVFIERTDAKAETPKSASPFNLAEKPKTVQLLLDFMLDVLLMPYG